MMAINRKGRKPVTSPDYEAWLPSGTLFERTDYPQFRELSISELKALIPISDDQQDELNARLKDISYEHWEFDNSVKKKPPAAWYRSKIRAIKEAAEDLLGAIRNCTGTSNQHLAFHFRRIATLRLFGSSEPSIETILKQLIGACEAAKPSANRGPIENRHVKNTVSDLIEVWKEYTAKPFPMSLDTAVHAKGTSRGVEFSSPAAHFVHQVMTRIDPDVSLSLVRTALRSCLKGPATQSDDEDDDDDENEKFYERKRGIRPPRRRLASDED